MLSKKNTQEYMRKTERDHFEFTIRKLSVGVVSVLLGFIFGTGMYANQGLVVHADVTSANTTTKTASTTSDSRSASSSTATSTLLATDSSAVQTSTASDTSTQTSVASEPTNSTTTHTQQSYADKEYGSYGPTNSVPTTDATKKADVDGDNQITTIYEANGYVPHTKTTVEKNLPIENNPDKNCIGTKTTTQYTDEVDLNAKSVMDTNLDDFSNNGYLEKVKNPNNHPNAYTNKTDNTTNFGPANLEVQHWQSGKNNATTAQYWRIVFGSDYAINNAVMTVTLPYSNVTASNATDWLVDRYYNITTNGNNIYTNKLTPKSLGIVNNIATITFGDIPAGSAYAIIFTKTFDTPQNFSNDLKVTSAHISGTWKSDELTSESKYISSSKTTPTITWTDQVCLIPAAPSTPSSVTPSGRMITLANATDSVTTNEIGKSITVVPEHDKATSKHVAQISEKKLPQTGEDESSFASVIGLILLGCLGILSALGLCKGKEVK